MTSAIGHVNVELLLEDFAWRHFKDIQSLRKTRNDEFRNVEREDVEFELNRKQLIIVHSEPEYVNFQATGAKPYTLFKSVYTNNTDREQAYSFKTERATESLCCVCREQGYTIGQEAEISLKTPCEIMEFKAGFKHEMHFNNITENTKSEMLTWGVDSEVTVPAHYQTTASIIIEEMSYQGSYHMVSRLSGPVTVNIRRRKDGLLIQSVTTNIVEVFRDIFEADHSKKSIVKSVATIENNTSTVKMVSKGSCSFQFAMKQRIDLSEHLLPTIDKEKMMID